MSDTCLLIRQSLRTNSYSETLLQLIGDTMNLEHSSLETFGVFFTTQSMIKFYRAFVE